MTDPAVCFAPAEILPRLAAAAHSFTPPPPSVKPLTPTPQVPQADRPTPRRTLTAQSTPPQDAAESARPSKDDIISMSRGPVSGQKGSVSPGVGLVSRGAEVAAVMSQHSPAVMSQHSPAVGGRPVMTHAVEEAAAEQLPIQVSLPCLPANFAGPSTFCNANNLTAVRALLDVHEQPDFSNLYLSQVLHLL